MAASFFVTGEAAANTLGTLNKLGCWLAKQTNAMSIALSHLLADADSVRHASLQNRAAIDFLLLAEGQGCEDFEGTCCMNLSDHSESIHKAIQELKKALIKLQMDGNWLNSLGLGTWFVLLIKGGLTMLFVVIRMLLIVPCLLSCLQ